MVTEKKNNWRWYKKQVGWWCFSTTGKAGDATNKETNESMLNALEKVCNVIKDFFIPTKIEIIIAPEETLYIQNDNGFMASEIKQIIINETNRLNSIGKDVFVIRINLREGKTNVFVYENEKIIEKWISPGMYDGTCNSIIDIMIDTMRNNSAPCIHFAVYSDIFLNRTISNFYDPLRKEEDNLELGELNHKKLEKVLKGFREVFPDAGLDYESEHFNQEYIYEYGFKRLIKNENQNTNFV